MADFDVAYLQELPVFKNIPGEHVQWLLNTGEIQALAPGEALFTKGQPSDYMHLILEGQINISLEQNGTYKYFVSVKKGEVTGVLPFSRLRAAAGQGIAAVPTKVLSLHRQHFPELERVSPELVQELVGIMTDRVRDFTRSQQQNEKLMALGKLSAGLAHELNNPAAAIVRSSSELLRIHHNVPEKFKRIMTMHVTPEQVDAVNNILLRVIAADLQSNLTLLARNSLEDEIIDWLEEQDVPDGYELAEILVESGVTLTDLEAIKTILAGNNLPEVLDWFANTLNTEKLICDIQASAKRISELVNAVKTYSHMDRGQDKEKTDLHHGLKSTLTMLTHKLKEKNIQVEQDYQANLPPITAYVGELNQVWTNLIDNAIDALAAGGKLRLATRQEGNSVKVTVADNGAGIPADVLNRIFEPFYTTKPVGKGTGLGLDIVNKILLHHDASIKVQSQPGNTVFEVCFPVA
ncbi:ATP-binding protein [Adhaeribacter rhizoryzae]|uniref:histidine kinase n=1 Tax=Adhaeribacter rhizoryzae TaxID=2607907 RepID=A0A5M6CZD8_9BACT|nr:ATP-binding protein [Adhaeribacter rhizoryzae]KAA5540598.1 cyclic nucleotide-binding domain-containing protein [Adhaeribacter rhizoryzae]